MHTQVQGSGLRWMTLYRPYNYKNTESEDGCGKIRISICPDQHAAIVNEAVCTNMEHQQPIQWGSLAKIKGLTALRGLSRAPPRGIALGGY